MEAGDDNYRPRRILINILSLRCYDLSVTLKGSASNCNKLQKQENIYSRIGFLISFFDNIVVSTGERNPGRLQFKFILSV